MPHTNYKIDKPRGDLQHHVKGKRDYEVYNGTVTTRHGIVAVTQWRGLKPRHVSSIRFTIVFRGREITLTTEGKTYSPQYLVTLANRFAADVVEGKYR